MLALLASASTPEQLAEAERLIAEAERAAAQPDVERVPLQKDAARILGVARVRLRDWELNSPWWRPEFRTAAGYDIAAITDAQASFDGGRPAKNPEENWADQQRRASAKLKELELEQRLLDHEQRKANILPADVYASFTRELLGMIRKRLEEIPARVARHCSPAARSAIRNNKGNAPLQREIEKLITDVEEWLKRTPEDDNADS